MTFLPVMVIKNLETHIMDKKSISQSWKRRHDTHHNDNQCNGLFATHSINDTVLSAVMLSVIMLKVVLMNVVILSAIMLDVVMLNVAVLSIVMLSV